MVKLRRKPTVSAKTRADARRAGTGKPKRTPAEQAALVKAAKARRTAAKAVDE